MINNTVIEFDKVSKKFQKGRKTNLKQALLDYLKPHSQEDFWALKDVNFKIRKGEVVGIIGVNGSGKSTILKLIAGVLTPTNGKVTVEGKIGPLIELGAGFHPEFTGRENIYLNGTILGLTKKEIDDKFESIVDFSGINEFLDTPVKHYSSGMYMRLGFSIAIHSNPDILLIDEILAVGDIAFQQKCYDKLVKFQKEGVTILLISHSLEIIKHFCNKIIFLDNGKILNIGAVENVSKRYLKRVANS